MVFISSASLMMAFTSVAELSEQEMLRRKHYLSGELVYYH